MTDPTDPTAARDDVVAGALRTIEVPGHRPGFWDALDRRLDALDGATPQHLDEDPRGDVDVDDDHEPGHEHDLVGPVGGRSTLPRVLAVAAVVAVVTLTAGLLAARRDATDVGPAGPSTSTTSTTTAPPGSGAVAPPEDAVLAWITAVGDGDAGAAAALTGPSSKAYVAALGGDLEGFIVEAGEGYGAWAVSPDRSTTEIDLGTEGGVTRAVVVVSGTWTGEGTDGFRVEALPVARTSDGPWLVEPWAFDPDAGGRLELVSPEPGEDGPGGLPPDGVIEVVAPGGGDFTFSLDDGEVVRVAGERAGAGVRGRFDPPGDLASRTHLLVASYQDGETFTALAFTFLVEG